MSLTFHVSPEGYSFANFNGTKGFLNQNDCNELVRHAKELDQESRYVEIGSFLGCSTLLVALNSNATVWAHDIWSLDSNANPVECPSENFFNFYAKVKEYNLRNRVIPIIGNSLKTIAMHDDDSIDLAFIDGDHSFEGTLGDFENVYPKMKKCGIILAHDCTPNSEPLEALKVFCKKNSLEFSILPGTCGMAKVVI